MGNNLKKRTTKIKTILNMALFILMVVGSISCSNYANLSKNFVKSGDFLLRGGVHGEKVWKSDLHFKRISWYHELTLLFDLYYSTIDSQSPFFVWFSDSEKNTIKNCKNYFVAITYNQNSDKISIGDFTKQLSDQEYSEFLLPYFSKNLRLHPDFEEVTFNRYKIHAFCQKNISDKTLLIGFPGHTNVKL